MHLYAGVTDKTWFDFLADIQPDEVNFWKPGGTQSFQAIEPGAPFLFKLHAPHDRIAGGGFFVKFQQMPLSLAWEVFGQKNGAPDHASFREAICRYRRNDPDRNPTIGCIVLASPFFLPPDRWLAVPSDWSPNIVSGKRYDSSTPVGSRLWDWAMAHLNCEEELAESQGLVAESPNTYGSPSLVRPRLGQGAFRLLVTEAYRRRCAISGEKTLPALEAAHIRPYTESGPHRVSNGLLLRADLHKLFDTGLITVTKDLRVEVSPKIKEEYENGREYYRFHGSPVGNLPDASHDRPGSQFLEWHNEQVFRR
jgi:putative restriction endonuclease